MRKTPFVSGEDYHIYNRGGGKRTNFFLKNDLYRFFNSISEYMKRIGGGYTNYFNIKYRRNGALFQGKFKSIHIDSNTYLAHLSAYVNLNNKVHKNNGIYGSSWQEYLNNRQSELCKKEIILEQ